MVSGFALFRRLVAVSLIAGLAAGLAATAVHMARLWPLIAQAEVYESAGGAPHEHAAGTPADHDHPAAEAGGWEPSEGFERMGLSLIANLLTGFGFALLLNAGMLLRQAASGTPADRTSGVVWGVAGFLCFALAPALGLPPEAPGAVAAALGDRQVWWMATAAATALGLAMIAFAPDRLNGYLIRAAGVIVIALPHIAGAPHPAEGQSTVPAELAAAFVAASLAAAAVFWLVLGGVSGWLLKRLA
jgi:cobalt transporter subunit CbtA